jgi:hypothetical protein
MKGKLTLGMLLSLCTIDARVIDVSEFGIVPGKDVTMAVNNLLVSLRAEENVVLRFPKGRYDFHPENALEEYRAVANHDNGLKRMAFPLFGHRNLTIEGNGSVFMFHGRLISFTLDGVSDVTLRNLVIDYVRPFHAELTVVERDEKAEAIVVEVDREQYPYTFVGRQIFFDRLGQRDRFAGQNILFDPKTRSPLFNASAFRLSEQTVEVQAAGPNRLKVSKAFKIQPPLGSVMVLYGDATTSRLCHAIQVVNSKNILIENVTIMAAGGMGLIVERTENVRLDRMKITSTESRLVSTRADATHFIGCKGLIEVTNCLFEHMLDDGINVHGAYVPVLMHLEGRTFLCEISHHQQWGLTFAEPGDKVAILSRKTVLPFFETTVAQVRKLNERRFVVTLESLPPELPDVPLSLENLTWNPDLVMRNNIIRENRARSVLVTTKGSVLIENNTFSSQMHGILIEGDNDFWYESGAVKDVVIRNNLFENIGFGSPRSYPLLAAPKFTRDQHMGEGRYHRNIVFSGNRVRSFTGNLAHARSVENLTIAGNRMELSTDYPVSTPEASVLLEYCREVVIRENAASGLDSPLKVNASQDSESIRLEKNIGWADADLTPQAATSTGPKTQSQQTSP